MNIFGGLYERHDFIVKRSGGYDTENNPLTPTSISRKGWIDRKQRKAVNDRGEDCLSSAKVLMAYDSAMTTMDMINFDGRDWRIVSVVHPRDFTGQHTEVYLV